jgi:hypothetical protein
MTSVMAPVAPSWLRASSPPDLAPRDMGRWRLPQSAAALSEAAAKNRLGKKLHHEAGGRHRPGKLSGRNDADDPIEAKIAEAE